MIRADRVAPNLYQGPVPARGPYAREAGFDLVVLAAKEYQPRARDFAGVKVLHAPLHDARPTLAEQAVIDQAATRVADALRSGERVLVTCFMGLNRSGVISALALRKLGCPRRVAIARVRKARGQHALGNPHFVALIMASPRGPSRVVAERLPVVGYPLRLL